MRVNSITVHNFRCFESLTVKFDSRLTVLVGKNGAGKSTVLDAVTIALGALSSELVKKKTYGISKGDVRNVCYALGSGIDVQPQYPVLIEADGMIANEPINWARILRNQSGRTVLYESENFKRLATSYSKRTAQGDASLILPIVSYYGTGRLWAQMKEKPKDTLAKTSRLNGYLDSLAASANNKLMIQWFRKMTMRDLQKGVTSPEFAAVKRAISRCVEFLTGSSDVEVFFNLDNFEISIKYSTSTGEQILSSLNQLSDGYKSTISLIADIAYRMSMLNPQLAEKVLEDTPGVVLIDEVDLHLHPAWQHRILQDLMNIFPKVQFIVTTHAPSVIHSTKEGRLVVLGDGLVQSDFLSPYGKDVNSVMSEIMDVPARPETIRNLFEDFYHQLDACEFDIAEKTLNNLTQILGEYDPEVTSCRVSLQLEKLV